jgi:transcriptional regulator with XRE-family HTH domain
MSNKITFREVFAQNFNLLLKKRNVTQQMLADVLKTTRQAIAQYADGTAIPSIEKLYKISKFFNISLDWFFIHDNNKDLTKNTNITSQDVRKYTGLSKKAIANLKNAQCETPKILKIINILLENLSSKEELFYGTVLDSIVEYYFFSSAGIVNPEDVFAITSNGEDDYIQKAEYFKVDGEIYYDDNQTIIYPRYLEEILLRKVGDSLKELKTNLESVREEEKSEEIILEIEKEIEKIEQKNNNDKKEISENGDNN